MTDGDMPDTAGVQESDIVFECPHCGKSLAIDGRGAGMVVVCPDCQARVQVPGEGDKDVSSYANISLEMQHLQSDNAHHFEEIGKELALIQSALDRIVGILQDATAGNVSRHR